MPLSNEPDATRLRSLLTQIDALTAEPHTRRNLGRSEHLCGEVEALLGARSAAREAAAQRGVDR